MAIYDLTKDYDKNTAIAKFNTYIEEGKKIDLKIVRNKRSIKSNSYLHVCITLFAIEFGWTIEEAKIFLKRECKFMTYQKIAKEGEKPVFFLKQTSQLDSKEMADFIDWIRTYSSQHGCYIPTSEEYLENSSAIDSKISNHNEYL